MLRTYTVEGFFKEAKDIIVYDGYDKNGVPIRRTYDEFFKDANGATAYDLEVNFDQNDDGEENGHVTFCIVNGEGTYRGYVGRYTTDEEKAEDDWGNGSIEILEFTEAYNTWLKKELKFFIGIALYGEFPWLLTYTMDCQIGMDGNGKIYASWENGKSLFFWDETDGIDDDRREYMGSYDLNTLTFEPDEDYPTDVEHAYRMRKAMCFCKFLANTIKAREEK